MRSKAETIRHGRWDEIFALEVAGQNISILVTMKGETWNVIRDLLGKAQADAGRHDSDLDHEVHNACAELLNAIERNV
jgi:hypothetical protein